MDTVEVLGVEFAKVSLREAINLATRMALSQRPHVVVTANPEFVHHYQRSEELRRLMARAAMVVADGAGVVWASRLLGRPLPERVPGVELVEGVLGTGRVCRVYLLGAKPGVAQEAGLKLKARYPHLEVVGTHHGYFRPEEEEQVIKSIAGSGAQLLLAGLGAPKQEIWLLRHGNALGVPLMIGVGGALDVFAGRVNRAPLVFRRAQLEWLWRITTEPRRLRRVPGLVWFLLAVLGQWWKLRGPVGKTGVDGSGT
ncbi:MAG: WecB/TagA/CpsF family glycosyltransferase [Bacillota bacterium]